MTGASGSYIPALRFERLTALYDPIVRLSTRERLFKRALLAQASLQSADNVLDLGCGTGTLAIMVKRDAPHARVSGVDGDAAILERARSKAAAAGVEVELAHGLADDLPYRDNSFDRVLSTLFFHHLTDAQKLRASREIARVLAPEGELHVADWGRPHDRLMRAAFLSIQLLDGFETTSTNAGGGLPAILAEGGLDQVEVSGRIRTPLGTIELIAAGAPAPSSIAE